MGNYAVIDDDFVKNIVVWDGEGDVFSNQETVEITEGILANIGDAFVSGVFIIKPRDGYEYDFDKNSSQWVMTDESKSKKASDQVSEAKSQKSELLSSAMERINLWQTEQSMGIISDADKASLTQWVIYIKALQGVDTLTAPDINWPTSPDDESTTSTSTDTTTGDAKTS